MRRLNIEKGALLLVSGLLCLSLVACGKEEEPILEVTPISVTAEESGTSAAGKKTSEEETLRREESAIETEYLTNGEAQTEGSTVARGAESLLQEDGETLETRVLTPAGYERVEAEEGSFEEFLRQYPMQPAGAKVHLYDGTEKGNQSAHVAVFALPIEEYDLQQCADSVMRMYAEYFWATEQYDRIKFHFTNGFLVEYSKWREGSRVTINGNNVSWIKSKSKDTSYECFVRYLRTIFCYAGTLSMEKESEPTLLSLLKAGDVFLYGGSPGHVVMVVDECVNEDGEKAFLLAQGYMPAQEFHLLKNDRHSADPWYYEDEITFPFSTPEYTFDEGSMRSLNY
ncbi:MAG: DUF4846 domain-containing protein [Lachnospiraceae bacterium]|nr:DUF4846 domain-containing protein [Lachnospiraceae bacterium]